MDGAAMGVMLNGPDLARGCEAPAGKAAARSPNRPWRRLAAAAIAGLLAGVGPAVAQVVAVEDSGVRIERIDVVLTNPSGDAALNARVIDLIRKNLTLFPSDRFDRNIAEAGLARARRSGQIAETSISVLPGAGGAVIVTVEAALQDDKAGAAGGGALLTGQPSDLPVLYDRNGTFVTGKIETLTMLYANSDAWYGRPDLFLTGNPLVDGNPAGAGATGWGEVFVHAGLYGITPLGETTFAYGGLSGILSGSAGRELFTDDTRRHFAVEDAYVGIVGGSTSDQGNRLVWNITAGRKRYAIGDGFLIANTAFNGSSRAALQSNPRWAADMLVLGQVKYNRTIVEAFYLDPDELPVVDAGTRLAGLNIETSPLPRLDLGGSYIRVLDSDFGYFALMPSSPPGATLSRDGLEVFDLRARWQAHSSGLYLSGEAALQRNDRFAMRATGIAGEVGYRFADATWSPEISYRLARFSGDDPATARFERWDPLLSGGNGEQWVQGINHFKLFQNSNLVAHRIQARLRPSPRVELVPQLWLFKADGTANLGGNPALSFLEGSDLAVEANLTAKYFVSRNLFIQGHLAATFPAGDLKQAPGVNGDLDPWVSAMVFLRYAF